MQFDKIHQLDKISKKCLFFAQTFHVISGGMEMHEMEFVKRVTYTITNDNGISLFKGGVMIANFMKKDNHKKLEDFFISYKPQVLFFNDLSFIKMLPYFRSVLYDIKIVIRSGGNDLFRAPIDNDKCPLYNRQHQIRDLINTNVDILIVNSDYSYFRSLKFGIKPNLMKKVRGGVDYCITNILRKNKERERKYYNSFFNNTDYRINLIIACRMKKFKGIDKFMEIFVKHKNCERFNLLIAGDGDELDHIKQIAHDRQDNIRFIGETNHNTILKLIAGADYLINPSILEERYYNNEHYTHTETMGRSMMEALVLNTPVIATNVGGTEELFLETVNPGFLLNSFSEFNYILSKIAFQDKTTEIATPNYSWDEIFKQYLQLIWGRKDVLVVDLDDTIIMHNTNISIIKQYFDGITRNIKIIINTARYVTQELFDLCKYLGVDFLIAGNGLKVFDFTRDYLWNHGSYISHEIIRECDEIYSTLLNTFSDNFNIKRTHPHIIHMDIKNQDIGAIERQLSTILHNSNFYYVHDREKLKILNIYLSKKSALEYILKDFPTGKIYAAGNSLNDYVFVSIADHKWLYDNLRNLPVNGEINYFNHEEIGETLVKKIVTTINQCDSHTML